MPGVARLPDAGAGRNVTAFDEDASVVRARERDRAVVGARREGHREPRAEARAADPAADAADADSTRATRHVANARDASADHRTLLEGRQSPFIEYT
jgi:hypothetical protein